MNHEIFKKYFRYHNPLFLPKEWFNVNQAKNNSIVNLVNDALTGLWNDFNKKKYPEIENPNQVIDIVEEILDFNKQQIKKQVTHLKTY